MEPRDLLRPLLSYCADLPGFSPDAVEVTETEYSIRVLLTDFDALRVRVAELKIEVEAKRQDHEAACCIIADMHRAAVGQITGPRRGVVEDVEDIHHMAECAAIMAVCGYFSRMHGPDAWETRWAGKGGPYAWGTGFLHKIHPDKVAKGTEIRPLYAGSAPVPAAQAEPDDKHVAAVRTLERCGYQYYDALAIGHYDWYLCKSAAQAVDAGTALSALSKAMQDDAGLAWSWHCNIAMTAQDAGAPHDRANVWAADFMRRAFDVDTLSRVNAMIAANAKGGGK